MPDSSDSLFFQADPHSILSNCAEFPTAGNYTCYFGIVPSGLLSQMRWRDVDARDAGAHRSAVRLQCACQLPARGPASLAELRRSNREAKEQKKENLLSLSKR